MTTAIMANDNIEFDPGEFPLSKSIHFKFIFNQRFGQIFFFYLNF
jgi:hypothetical protein